MIILYDKDILITYIVILLHFKAHCFDIINANKGSLNLDNLIVFVDAVHAYRSFHVCRWCKMIICDVTDTCSNKFAVVDEHMGQISQPQHIYGAAGENGVLNGRKTNV